MEQNTYNEYRNKARKLYEKTISQYKNLWVHVETVEKVAQFFCEYADLSQEEKYTIYLGCILHDIGKTDEAKLYLSKRKKHNKGGAEYLNKYFFTETSIAKSDKKIILHMVKQHRGKLKFKNLNDPIECLAVTLVRIADDFANQKILMSNGKVYIRYKGRVK